MSETIRMVEWSVEMERNIWSAGYDAMVANRANVIFFLKKLRSDTVRSDKRLEQAYRDLIRRSITDYRKAERALHWVTDDKASVLLNPVTKEVICLASKEAE